MSSDALVVEDLGQGVVDGDEVLLVVHDLVDVLVGPRVLVDERFGISVVPRLAGICSRSPSRSSSRRARPRESRRPAPCEHEQYDADDPRPMTMYDRVPIDPGMTPRSPVRARMAPLRVTHTLRPWWCSRSVNSVSAHGLLTNAPELGGTGRLLADRVIARSLTGRGGTGFT